MLIRRRGVITALSAAPGDEHVVVTLDGPKSLGGQRVRVPLEDVVVDDPTLLFSEEVNVLFRDNEVVAVVAPDPRIMPRFPHCDARVLHAPGECRYCDMHPDWQRLREAWNIAFTGHSDDKTKTTCPAEAARPAGKIARWYGNRAFPEPSPDINDGSCPRCGVNSAEAHMDHCPNAETR